MLRPGTYSTGRALNCCCSSSSSTSCWLLQLLGLLRVLVSSRGACRVQGLVGVVLVLIVIQGCACRRPRCALQRAGHLPLYTPRPW
jgi:hypothetical protein